MGMTGKGLGVVGFWALFIGEALLAFLELDP